MTDKLALILYLISNQINLSIEKMRLSKHQEEIAIAVARKKRMKPEEFLLKLLLEQYRATFKKEYLL